VARAAQGLVGARFRLHGRDPATGLDCVGVVACATGAIAPTGYGLRGGTVEQAAEAMARAGLAVVAAAAPGDIVLMRTGPGQLHLGVRTESGLVHADAGLRRVVERPGAPEWEVLGTWRRLY
jgi:murein DD-endopeptidase / murein LD-carboxypeptidase